MTAKKKASHKLDIWDILGRIANKKPEFTDEEMKAVQPMVLMRWLSGTRQEYQILAHNMLTNKYVFHLTNHKQLLLNLLSVPMAGPQRFMWLKREKKDSKFPKATEVVSKFYKMPTRHVPETLKILSPDAIIAFAEELGFDDKYIKELKKETKLL